MTIFPGEIVYCTKGTRKNCWGICVANVWLEGLDYIMPESERVIDVVHFTKDGFIHEEIEQGNIEKRIPTKSVLHVAKRCLKHYLVNLKWLNNLEYLELIYNGNTSR